MPLSPSSTVSADSDTVAPASSSVTVTVTSAMVTLSYSPALSSAITAWAMEAASFTRVGVVGGGHRHCLGCAPVARVKVRVAAVAVTSRLSLDTAITTSEEGWASSTTV